MECFVLGGENHQKSLVNGSLVPTQLLYHFTKQYKPNLIFNCHRDLADSLNDEVPGGDFGRLTREDTAQQEDKLSMTHTHWRLQCGFTIFFPGNSCLSHSVKIEEDIRLKKKNEAQGIRQKDICSIVLSHMHLHTHSFCHTEKDSLTLDRVEGFTLESSNQMR